MQSQNKHIAPSTPDHIYPHAGLVSKSARNQAQGHRSGVVWLTGMSGAGKSTIASQVERALFQDDYLITVLDGDSMRSGLNADLDFSEKSRLENLRRSAEVAALLSERGFIVLATFISPFQMGRDIARNIIGPDFHLVHVHADMEDCIKRDPKDLYKKAMAGKIPNFTGISQAYETPSTPELYIDTSRHDLFSCCQQLTHYIVNHFGLE